ncbi:MAG TPA: glycosyltransferase [Acidimicrobiales bacterium]|nr:glycosyltransferase [Acidimicrobiales bacterium]
MTRVVQLANFYGPCTGGIKTVLEELARWYSSAGIDRALIAPGPADAQESDEHGTRFFLRAPVVLGSGGYRMILRRRALSELLDRLDPDAVEVSDKLTLVAAAGWARRRGIPCTLLSHERIDAILRDRVPAGVPLGRIADAWNAKLARSFDTVVCPSRFASAEFERIGAANVTVVPWGVDLDAFSPRARPPALPTTPGHLELACVGRLSKEKEPGLAVDVLAELCRRGVDAQLTMVGSGPLHAELEQRAIDLPVTFAGHVHERAGVARVLATADVTLAPCRAETFGLAILESLACGTPVVTSDSGAGSEVSGPTCGLAAPNDAARMADAVTRLLEQDGQRLRRRARERAEQFSWAGAADAVLSVQLGGRTPARCP